MTKKKKRIFSTFFSALLCACCSPSLSSPLSVPAPPAVSGGVTTAHQVPAVSQSAYSPPTPETPDSIMSTPPQTHLTKSLPPVFSAEQSIPAAPALPPTQPTTKVRTQVGVSALFFASSSSACTAAPTSSVEPKGENEVRSWQGEVAWIQLCSGSFDHFSKRFVFHQVSVCL